MHAFHERDTPCGCVGGMRAIIIHHGPAINLKKGTVVAAHGEFPDPVGRNVKIAREYVTEMILVRSLPDRRRRHDSGRDGFTRPHVACAGEKSGVVGVTATFLESGNLGRRDFNRGDSTGPHQFTVP